MNYENTSNYKLTDFGLYVPAHVAERMNKLDMTTVSLYESHLHAQGKASATVEKYLYFIRLFTLFLGDHYLSVKYVRAWLESLKKRRHINTVNGAISALNGFFKWLGRDDCVVSFYPHQEPQYREDSRSLDKDEFNCLLDAADRRMKTILLTFYGTGVRVSELRFFTVEAVRTGAVTVDNKGKVRTVFLEPGTKTLLLDYCEKQGIESGVIFRSRLGAALSRTYIWRSMKKLAEKAGVMLSKVFPHNLRHLFAVERYKADRDLECLRLDMGHSLIATTQRYLKETAREHFRKVLQRTAALAG